MMLSRPIARLRGWLGDFHPRRTHYGWLVPTVLVGMVGAAAFVFCRLPLPWMLGPMVFSMALALAGVPLVMPQALRSPMLVVLGVMVGATATPELVSRLPEWLGPLAGLLLVMVAGTAVSFVYFRRAAGYDQPTSYFASVPGGLTEMILLSESSGGDHRLVALSHAVRVTMVVLVVPFLVQWFSGTSLGARQPAGVPLLQLPVEHIAWFVGTFALGAFLASFVSSITALFLAAMLVSSLFHGTGLTNFAIPREAGLVAQLIVGLSLGCRFYGMKLRTVGASLLWAMGASIVLLGMALLVAFVLAYLTGESLIALFLAYAPAGVAEMSLIAISLHMEVAFVVLHHLMRLLLITLSARAIYVALTRGRPAKARD